MIIEVPHAPTCASHLLILQHHDAPEAYRVKCLTCGALSREFPDRSILTPTCAGKWTLERDDARYKDSDGRPYFDILDGKGEVVACVPEQSARTIVEHRNKELDLLLCSPPSSPAKSLTPPTTEKEK